MNIIVNSSVSLHSEREHKPINRSIYKGKGMITILILWELLNMPIVTEIVGGAIIFYISAKYAQNQSKKESERVREEMYKRIDREAEKSLETEKRFYAERYEIDLLGQIEIEMENLIQLVSGIRFEYKKLGEKSEEKRKEKLDKFAKDVVSPLTSIINSLHILEIYDFDKNIDKVKELLVTIAMLENDDQFPDEKYGEAKCSLSIINNKVYSMQYKKIKEWKQPKE